LNAQYVFNWHRTLITLSSDSAWFHTESFRSSNANVRANGNSETWQGKIDVDVPLSKEVFGHELRTGGYFSRTELYGDLRNGLGADHIYELHGRLVLDFLNQFWKCNGSAWADRTCGAAISSVGRLGPTSPSNSDLGPPASLCICAITEDERTSRQNEN